MNVKQGVVGAVITLVIGGTAYTINQEDVVDNFADDTGLTQEQAEQYINDIEEDELASWSEIGLSYVEEGEEVLNVASELDCMAYTYDWESSELTCDEGKEQLSKLGEDSISLGRAYAQLDSDTASDEDISLTISYIDTVNADYDFDIVRAFLDDEAIDEDKKTGSYNKSLLETVLDSY